MHANKKPVNSENWSTTKLNGLCYYYYYFFTFFFLVLLLLTLFLRN